MPPPVLTQKGSPFKGPTMAMKSGCWSRANTALMRDCRPVSVPKWLEGNLSMRRGGGSQEAGVALSHPAPPRRPPGAALCEAGGVDWKSLSDVRATKLASDTYYLCDNSK